MAVIEMSPEPSQEETQDCVLEIYPRVPAKISGLICSSLGYRIKYVEEGGHVLLEPLRPGETHYETVPVINPPKN